MREFDSRRGHKSGPETSQDLPHYYDEGIPHCILRMQNQHPPLLTTAGLLLLEPPPQGNGSASYNRSAASTSRSAIRIADFAVVADDLDGP